MSRSPTKVVCVMGPTAAGKTELAVALARRFDAEIVSVDSAQVYRGMDIGTAKPGPALRAEIPHHLIDIRDAAEPYSAAEFRAEALAAIADITARGRHALLAGGTMLYFRALTGGLSPLPSSNPEVRAGLESLQRERGVGFLHERLSQADPESAQRIHPNDPQRIKRALEVFEITGRPMSALLADAPEPPEGINCLRLVLMPEEREDLHRRIEQRFHAMLEDGLVEEVAALHERGDLDENLPSVRSVGYRQVWQYLEGRVDYPGMVSRGIAATRQLAKRQITWLRRETSAVWLKQNNDSVIQCACEEVRRHFGGKP